MKVIDLLNRIANGEDFPDVVEQYNDCFTWDSDYNDWRNEDNSKGLLEYNFPHTLNNKVKILQVVIEEDKKIEKITTRAGMVGNIENKLENLDINIMAVEDKINEIIDYINKKER